MKKILMFMLLVVSMTTAAQKDVTKFLGIPVDGYKTEMKKKLMDKGFTYNSENDFFEGEFNGFDVHVFVKTNNNKVCRIVVCDKNFCGETDIKIRFNKLCRQFAKNHKYIATNMGEKEYIIPAEEDISYEILVNKKRYEASYYQYPDTSTMDTPEIRDRIKNNLLKKYTQEEIDNPSDKQREMMESIWKYEYKKIYFEMLEKKSVWFKICEYNGKYYIAIYYDNEYNRSDGEDL